MKKLISIVVPMYNEHEMVDIFFERINQIVQENNAYDFEILVVNDGSKDDTLALLKEHKKHQSNLTIVSLSRNFGHEPAVAAGLSKAKGDAVVVMDCDMQDPPEVISEMLKKFEEGYEVVNGRRASRKEDSMMKRLTAKEFYKICDKMSGKIRVPQNVGHFRLISRRVIDEVNKLTENNRVFRIQVPYVGFKTTEVLFTRAKREKGKTKYNYKSMTKLAMDAFASSTIEPLTWPIKWGVFSTALTGLSFLVELILFILFKTNTFMGISTNGYAFWCILNCIFLALSVLLIALGIVSLYMSRMYLDTQKRPFYIIDEYEERDDQ